MYILDNIKTLRLKSRSLLTLYKKEYPMKIKKKRKYNPPLSHSNQTTQDNLRSIFDPNGSYTGTPEHHGYPEIPDGDLPVQDADDL